VNPKAANALCTAAGAKTDQIDAYLLAKAGRFGLADLRRLTPESAIVQELQTLTRDQDSLVEMQTRLVNQLTACLKDYYPVALQLFDKLQQACTLRFLQAYPTPQAAASASVADLAATLRQGTYPKADTAAAKLIEQLHRPN
jgi:transposase